MERQKKGTILVAGVDVPFYIDHAKKGHRFIADENGNMKCDPDYCENDDLWAYQDDLIDSFIVLNRPTIIICKKKDTV